MIRTTTRMIGLLLTMALPSKGILAEELKSITPSQLKVQTIDQKFVDPTNAKATVFLCVTTNCPIANAYQPRIAQLHRQVREHGIQFVQVYPVSHITTEAIRQHVEQFSITTPCVADPDKRLAKLLDARVTPEAIVVDTQGTILYRGRIDDQYAALGKKRPEPTRNDLQEILQAVVAGKPVINTASPAVGCLIRYHKDES